MPLIVKLCTLTKLVAATAAPAYTSQTGCLFCKSLCNASRTSCTVNRSAASTKCLMEWQRVAHRGPARLGSCTAAAQHAMLGHRRLIVLLAVTSPTGINNMLLYVVKSGIQLKTEPTCALAGSGSGSQDSLAETVKQNIYKYSQSKVIIDQTGNRRSEDVEGEKAPGNKQQKHRFVVSTDVFCLSHLLLT